MIHNLQSYIMVFGGGMFITGWDTWIYTAVSVIRGGGGGGGGGGGAHPGVGLHTGPILQHAGQHPDISR